MRGSKNEAKKTTQQTPWQNTPILEIRSVVCVLHYGSFYVLWRSLTYFDLVPTSVLSRNTEVEVACNKFTILVRLLSALFQMRQI